MALLTKVILPQNVYKVRSGNSRLPKAFDEAYLQRIAKVSNDMLDAGLKIPAPFDHQKEAIPMTEKQIEENKSSSSFHNAGYWTSFWVAPNNKGVPSLYGLVDVAGDISDPSSPAFKAMNTAKEVSISLANRFEDGFGRTWTDGLMHVALVNHAVVPDQEPFQDNTTIVNLSMIELSSHQDNTSIIEELKAALKKVKINLPGSTDEKSFLRDLLVAVSQVGDNVPDKLEPAPIYMSTEGDNMKLSQAQAEALVKSGTVNPVTNKPFTLEDLGISASPKTTDLSALEKLIAEKDKAIEGLKGMVVGIKNKFQAEKQQSIQQRISSLVAKGVITKEYADTVLSPKVQFEMSLTNPEDHPLEISLSTLEALPAAKQPNNDAGNLVDNPGLGGLELTNDQMEAALKAFEADGIL